MESGGKCGQDIAVWRPGETKRGLAVLPIPDIPHLHHDTPQQPPNNVSPANIRGSDTVRDEVGHRAGVVANDLSVNGS